MVCFVVTQHSESELSLCLRYSKTSSLQATQKKSTDHTENTEKDFRRMIKTTPSDFIPQTSDFIFALQSLQLTVLQFLKTIFLRYS